MQAGTFLNANFETVPNTLKSNQTQLCSGRILNARLQQTCKVNIHCLWSYEHAQVWENAHSFPKNDGFSWYVCCHLVSLSPGHFINKLPPADGTVFLPLLEKLRLFMSFKRVSFQSQSDPITLSFSIKGLATFGSLALYKSSCYYY